MSQSNMQIANQTFPLVRTAITAALQALASQSSGDAAPATTYPGQPWFDTANSKLKMRNAANNAWLTLATIDVANDRWQLHTDVLNLLSTAGLTLKSSAGTTLLTLSNAGVLDALSIKLNGVLLGSFATKNLLDFALSDAIWTAGTGTTQGIPTPAQVVLTAGGQIAKFAAGDTGQPLNAFAWHPYDAVTYGDGAIGVVYDYTVDGVVGSVTLPALEAGFEYMFVIEGIRLQYNNSVVYLEPFDTAWRQLTGWAQASASNYGYGIAILPRLTDTRQTKYRSAISRVSGDGATFMQTEHDVLMGDTGAPTQLRARSSNSFQAGVLRLFKRKFIE